VDERFPCDAVPTAPCRPVTPRGLEHCLVPSSFSRSALDPCQRISPRSHTIAELVGEPGNVVR
jgi:hypothetical protein